MNILFDHHVLLSTAFDAVRRNAHAQDQQVGEYRSTRAQDDRMNQVEKGINSPIIRDATGDALMRSRVMHRMRHTKSSQGR